MFLFVNSDANTVKKVREPSLDRLVHSHVQRSLRKMKRKTGSQPRKYQIAHNEKLSSRTSLISSIQHADVPQWRNPESPDSFGRSMYTLGDGYWSSDTSSPSADEDVPSPCSSHSSIITDREVSTRSSQQSYVRSQLDRWTQIVSPVEPEALLRYASCLLRYWTDVLIPERFYFDTQYSQSSSFRYAESIQSELDDLTTRPSHLYSLLTAVTVQLVVRNDSFDILGLGGSETTDLALSFKVKALGALRRDISEGIRDSGLVRDVQSLATSAYLMDEYDNAEIHFTAMMSVVESLGGLEKLDSYLIENEITIHWYAALRKLQRPIIKLWNLVSEPTETSTFREYQSAWVPGKIFHTRRQLIIDSGLRDCFVAPIERLAWVIESTKWMELQETYDAQYCKWASLQHLSIGYDLLNMEGASDIEEAFRLACIYFVGLTRSASFDQCCASKSVPRLKKLLETVIRSQESCSRSISILLLWIAAVGGLTAFHTSAEPWFADVVAGISERLQLRFFEELETCLVGFLFDDRLHQSLARFYKNQVLAHLQT